MPVPQGHRTLVLSAAELQGILDSGNTASEMRQAIMAIIYREVKLWGLDEADQAEAGLMQLIPSESWPVNVPLNGL
jgi:hypothetical protein